MADVFRTRRGGFRCRKGVKKSRQDKQLSRDEFVALLAAARSDPAVHGKHAYLSFFLAGNFGLRSGEVTDLRWEDFKSLRFGYFRVRTLKKKAEQDDRVYVGRSWTQDVERSLSTVRRSKGTDRILPFSTRTLRFFFAYYADQVGVSPNVSFHALRHSAAQRVYAATKDTRIVNCFLRHKPETTHIYLEPSAEEMIEAIEKTGVIS